MEKLVYVSKSDYDKIKAGDMDSSAILDVLKKYVKTEVGEKLDGWGEAEMKVVSWVGRDWIDKSAFCKCFSELPHPLLVWDNPPNNQ